MFHRKKATQCSLFQNRPMDFLLKPVKENDIERILNEYKRIFGGRKLFFEFHIGKTAYRIATDEIIYFQCIGKKIQIVMYNGDKKEFYGGMSEVERKVNPAKFWILHKSFIVNINYIAEFRIDEVILVTGDRLPISRANQKKIQEKLLDLNMAGRDFR